MKSKYNNLLVMKNFLLLFLILFIACSTNIPGVKRPYPDQYSGEDLFSQMSHAEKTMLGKWYFGKRYFIMQDGTDSIDYWSGSGYAMNDRTDTIEFYSTELVGFNWDCPYENPTMSNVKLIKSKSARYFYPCWPSGFNGWLIENETLIYYEGFNNDAFIYYPIQIINNDSILFLYNDYPGEGISGVDKEYAVFYKK